MIIVPQHSRRPIQRIYPHDSISPSQNSTMIFFLLTHVSHKRLFVNHACVSTVLTRANITQAKLDETFVNQICRRAQVECYGCLVLH